MNRSEEPAIDPGAGLRTRIVGLDDLGAAAFGNIAVRRVPEAELISPLPLTAMAR